MHLILWRHAEAVDGTPDHYRALTTKGIKQAEKISAFLASQLPDGYRVLASPSARATDRRHPYRSFLDRANNCPRRISTSRITGCALA